MKIPAQVGQQQKPADQSGIDAGAELAVVGQRGWRRQPSRPAGTEVVTNSTLRCRRQPAVRLTAQPVSAMPIGLQSREAPRTCIRPLIEEGAGCGGDRVGDEGGRDQQPGGTDWR